MKILLASASPRRSELLRQLGIAHEVLAVNMDETPQPGEEAAEYVMRLALAKARAAQMQCRDLPVLGADTAVVLDGQIFGKPRDREDALAMLARLSGSVHHVYSAVAWVQAPAVEAVRLSVSRVRMRSISRAEAAAYWDTGEPHDKAGAYAIQGRAAMFIEHLDGSYSGVMGLPLFETAALLNENGLSVLE